MRLLAIPVSLAAVGVFGFAVGAFKEMLREDDYRRNYWVLMFPVSLLALSCLFAFADFLLLTGRG